MTSLDHALTIRDETPSDAEAIARVTTAAFADHPFSRQTEAFIVRALRDAGALSLSLVAELDGRVVGHAAFSPVTIEDGTADWYGLGPISVDPPLQRRGIGGALLRAGLERLRGRGARGFALVGDPGYYRRFGFRNEPGLVHEGVPPEVFLVLPLADPVPRGRVVFRPGFGATA